MAQWTFDELGALAGVNRRTVDKWRADGMPVLGKKRGNAILVDSVAWLEWYVARATRDRNKAAKRPDVDWTAEKRRLEVEQIQKQLLPAADVRRLWRDQCAIIRKMVLALPNRCAALVAHKDEATARATLDREVKRTLTELVEYDEKRQREGTD